MMELDYTKIGTKKMKKKLLPSQRVSVGADLDHFDADKTISTDAHENTRRRTLKLERRDNSWGFTLQSYGIKHKKTNEIEVMTYVDYVELGGAAWYAGMRKGDVILSVNGEKVGDATHRQLVRRIKQSGPTLRLVVLFEDCCRKVELHDRFLKLKMVLKSKLEELHQLERKEFEILNGAGTFSNGMNRFESMRHSVISNVSSDSNSWDAYSLVSTPNLLQPNSGQVSRWSSVSSVRSFYMGDNSSTIMGDNSSITETNCEDSLEFIDGGESDSDGISIQCQPNNAVFKDGGESKVSTTNNGVQRNTRKLIKVTVTDFCDFNRDSIEDDVFTSETNNNNNNSDREGLESSQELNQNSSMKTIEESDNTSSNTEERLSVQTNRMIENGASIPYERLKRSIPEIITFHEDDFKLVYINDEDVCTQF